MLQVESLGLVVPTVTVSGPSLSSWPASVKIRSHPVPTH